MARKVANWPSNSKYPWDEWLDGGIWELVPGEDFKVSVQSFKNTAYAAAHRRSLDLTAKISNHKLYVQARGDSDD